MLSHRVIFMFSLNKVFICMISIFRFIKKSYIHLFAIITFIICSSILSGCTCSSLRGCPPREWFQIGYCDGVQGLQRDVSYFNNCALQVMEPRICDPGCVPDPAYDYFEGWRKGVREFCTPRNGYAIGLTGQSFPCVCPPDLAGPFRAAWYQGLKCYYFPELGCGDGCSKEYCTLPVPCGVVGQLMTVPAGCPCNVVN